MSQTLKKVLYGGVEEGDARVGEDGRPLTVVLCSPNARHRKDLVRRVQ